MEPRPQKPRQQPPQRPASPPDGATSSTETQPIGGPQAGYHSAPQEHGTYIAPPRNDYDYRPLDLQPPGQRRRKQFLAAAVGALSILLLGALVVVGYTLLHDPNGNDDPNETGENRVAQATNSPAVQAPANATSTTAPATQTTTGTASTETSAGPKATLAPTSAGSDEETLKTLLPTTGVPEGFDTGTDATQDRETVVNALGGNRTAEQNLTAWGWNGNVTRTFVNQAPVEGSTTVLLVSIHGFKDGPAAAEALSYYASILMNGGATAVDVPAMGDNSRAMSITDEQGVTTVTVYVQKDNVLYRFAGTATNGDPTQDVVNLATATLGN